MRTISNNLEKIFSRLLENQSSNIDSLKKILIDQDFNDKLNNKKIGNIMQIFQENISEKIKKTEKDFFSEYSSDEINSVNEKKRLSLIINTEGIAAPEEPQILNM